jgi:hypothetical protein
LDALLNVQRQSQILDEALRANAEDARRAKDTTKPEICAGVSGECCRKLLE